MQKRELRFNLLEQLIAFRFVTLSMPEESDCCVIENLHHAQQGAAEEKWNDTTEADNQIHAAERDIGSIFHHRFRGVVHIDHHIIRVDWLLVKYRTDIITVIDSRAFRQATTLHALGVGIKERIIVLWLLSVEEIVVLD